MNRWSATLPGPFLWLMGSVRPERSGSVEAIDDAALVERARNGDARAADQLFRRYGGLVLNTVARQLRTKDGASDIAQDTFLYACSHLDQLRDPTKFRQWILRIAVMNVRQVIRRRRMKRRLGLETMTEDASLRALASPQWSPEMRAQVAMIDDILGALPPEHRAAWTLRYVEGYKLREVAEIGGWSVSSAKRYISAAQTKIQERVDYGVEADDE